jgi:hypothetical protein
LLRLSNEEILLPLSLCLSQPGSQLLSNPISSGGYIDLFQPGILFGNAREADFLFAH